MDKGPNQTKDFSFPRMAFGKNKMFILKCLV